MQHVCRTRRVEVDDQDLRARRIVVHERSHDVGNPVDVANRERQPAKLGIDPLAITLLWREDQQPVDAHWRSIAGLAMKVPPDVIGRE